jgi:hypothetical protein
MNAYAHTGSPYQLRLNEPGQIVRRHDLRHLLDEFGSNEGDCLPEYVFSNLT